MCFCGTPANHDAGNSFQHSDSCSPVTPDVMGRQYVPPNAPSRITLGAGATGRTQIEREEARQGAGADR